VTGLLQETVELWQHSPATLPPFERAYTEDEQAAREGDLRQFLESLRAEVRRLPRTRVDRAAAHGRITDSFERFARSGLELQDSHVDLLLRRGFAAVGTALAREARRFDPAVSAADIFQATRNAWTACALQMLLGREMGLTPAIFAYSMLYPYTDNYMDEPGVTRDAKSVFSARFGRRLAGEAVAPANQREEGIWRLVGMVETQYPRVDYPQVFESLLAIHRAQENSLRLLRGSPAATDVDVLRLGFAKGGLSVLADAYLAAGSLSHAEARFAFAWGVALQLADDLQDVREDGRAGVLTLFSIAAEAAEPLDALTSRTMQFARAVAQQMPRLPGLRFQALEELIRKSSSSLLIRAAGAAGDLHTTGYVSSLEAHSPFRFAFLGHQHREMAQREGPLTRLFDAFLAGDDDEPAFPLLPGSLMPRV
jgi:hypothetical protein